MILSLRFRPEPSGMVGHRFVREAQFERVTDLPLSTVCHAANHARDRLSALLGGELVVDVFAPVLLQSETREVLFDGLHFVAEGSTCDAYVIFREADARRLAAAVFGTEADTEPRPLSTLEERALERIATEVAALCTPFCGEVATVRRGEPQAPPCVTYLELKIGAPVGAVVGIGLSRDPGPMPGAALERRALGGVAVDITAEFARARIDAREIAQWTVGSVVRMDTKIGAPTVLKIGALEIARGDCGVRAQTNAVAITSSPFEEAVR